MFKRLREKWGVSPRQFWVIFLVFALTGTTAAFLTRYLTHWLGMDASTHWGWKLLLRLAMLLIGYQFLLLFYGALLGEWAFFWKYERKLLVKLGLLRPRQQEIQTDKSRLFIRDSFQQNSSRTKTNIAIFASGTGSNAEKIIAHLKKHPSLQVALIVSNKPDAGVLKIAAANHVPTLVIEKERFFRGDSYLPELEQHGIRFIVLAGFLLKVPTALIAAFPNRIINIHPALLPKYGGKGMYGMRVHEAVLAAGEKESGITIHFVNEHFDEGEHIFQTTCPVDPNDTPESLAQKVHALEHEWYPKVVERVCSL